MRNYIKTHDGRLNSDNYLFEMTIEEYYDLVKNRLKDNRYQRKRVKSSSSVYGLLKDDLILGCLMPPIVLALEGRIDESQDIAAQLQSTDNTILILDGLQRSYTIRDLVLAESSALFDNRFNEFKDNRIRVELYTEINRSSLLYRMLTLNTGQTRMSVRHQIEIIYSDLLDSPQTEDIRFITDLDTTKEDRIGVYSFRDAIEGFTSYVMEDYLLLDRQDLLENVKQLERLTDMTIGKKDLFAEFITNYTYLIRELDKKGGYEFINILQDEIYSDEDETLEDKRKKFVPFGSSVNRIFSKSQALTGFGNAVAKLKSRGDLSNFDSIKAIADRIDKSTIADGLIEMIKSLEKLRHTAKKIGNDQRFYFYAFFKSLFSSEDDSINLLQASKSAWRQYEREFL
ncbi:MAG: hypothetical protein K2L11_11565 [Muribaculaceae bacterium]|nr:hypothetical protein [Muribaculaceae bacterium]